jgi:uncharacterized protein (DUF305 family)
MSRTFPQWLGAGLLAVAMTAACNKVDDGPKAGAAQPAVALAPGTGAQPVTNGQTTLSDAAKGNKGREATAADVEFMTGMISHHAQAIIMAGWAPTHGARDDLRRLCERIVVGQGDEIALMQGWLRFQGQPVPDAHDTKMHMKMGDMTHDMLMPGMLTDEQMQALDKARGHEFDVLFLRGMIQHHGGAITMVNKLFGSDGAAQDEVVFKFANDVFADQSTEIARMQQMLGADSVVAGSHNSP